MIAIGNYIGKFVETDDGVSMGAIIAENFDENSTTVFDNFSHRYVLNSSIENVGLNYTIDINNYLI